jgi:hypothetical protein
VSVGSGSIYFFKFSNFLFSKVVFWFRMGNYFFKEARISWSLVERTLGVSSKLLAILF